MRPSALTSQEDTSLSLYQKQIELLISLQKVDDDIHGIRQDLDAAPQELENLRSRFAEASAQRTLQQDKMAHLHDQEKRLGLEIEDESIRIKRSKSKLMTAGNSKEYHAMMREMDTLERSNRNREEEKTALVEELERQTSLLAEVEALHISLQNELAACEASLQERIATGESSLAALMQKRQEAAKDVPGPVFARYEFIRERLPHPVIVPVAQGICSGCHIAIPPQNYIELQKAAQILSCPNCQRLMFWDEPSRAEREQ